MLFFYCSKTKNCYSYLMKKNITLKKLVKLADENPIISMFLVNAINQTALSVINNQEEVKKEMARSIVAPNAWISAAIEVNNVFNQSER